MLFSLILPPGYPVQIYIIVRAIMHDHQAAYASLVGVQTVVQSLLGLLAGWGIGSAAMKASLSVRSYLVDEATLQKAANKSVASLVAELIFPSDPNPAFKVP
jgi:hypothetical protein